MESHTPEDAVDELMRLEHWFDKCVKKKKRQYGTLQISCKLGLWSVEGRDHLHVKSNAMHYWLQYYKAGEYDDILYPKAPSKSTKSTLNAVATNKCQINFEQQEAE